MNAGIKKMTFVILNKKLFLKESGEQFPGLFPGFLVDAVFNFRRFYCPLDEAGVFQFLQMLRDGRLRHRELIHYIAGITGALALQKLHDAHPRRMSQGFGITGYFFLLIGIRASRCFHDQ